MAANDSSTLISLFHTPELAQDALADLRDAAVPAASIQTLTSGNDAGSLSQLELPSKDLELLSNGLRSGGTVIIVSATDAFSGDVESIFKKHQAHKIDEHITHDDDDRLHQGIVGGVAAAAATRDLSATAGDVVIPIVEEELVVGKRAVQSGGVRVYSRITEAPVQEQVSLHEEHAVVERRPVNRAVTDSDRHAFKEQSVEITEMAEEAVVGKTARVVEEVVVGKDATNRTERVTETVRKTEVDVESFDSGDRKAPNAVS